MKLSLLAVSLGAVMAVPQIYGIANPRKFAALAQKFPRNLPAGIVLMLLGTAWFVWNVQVEPIADFSTFKPYMLLAFAAIGILSCFFVQDFLAVRGLAVVLLLLAKLMVDTGRPHLGESHWVLVIQCLAYAFVLAGIWFTITPWKLRDAIQWATANEARIKLWCGLRLALALLIFVLGFTAFRAM